MPSRTTPSAGYLEYASGSGLVGFSSLVKAFGPAIGKATMIASLIPPLAPIANVVGLVAPLALKYMTKAQKGQRVAPQIMEAAPAVTQAVNSLLPAAATSPTAVNQITQLVAQLGAAVVQDKTTATAQAASSGRQLPEGVFVGPNGRLMRIVPNASPQTVRQSVQAATRTEGGAALLLGGFVLLALSRKRRR